MIIIFQEVRDLVDKSKGINGGRKKIGGLEPHLHDPSMDPINHAFGACHNSWVLMAEINPNRN